MQWPNFLIVGAPKCATTSLYEYFLHHPDVFLSGVRKEGRFFSEIGQGNVFWPANYPYPCSNSVQEYSKIFKDYANQKLIGDVSPDYFAYPEVSIRNIKKYCGENVKIIIMVRDPIERSFSHYLQNVRRGSEHFSFHKALQIENVRKDDNWGFQWLYASTSFFSQRITLFKKSFRYVQVYSKHELDEHPKSVLQRMHDFLGIELQSDLQLPRLNTGGIQQEKIDTVLKGDFDSQLHLLNRAAYTGEFIMTKPTRDTSFDCGGTLIPFGVHNIKPDTLHVLKKRFMQDIIALQELHGINLSLRRYDDY